jgi:hypothetical protein
MAVHLLVSLVKGHMGIATMSADGVLAPDAGSGEGL